MATAHFTTTSCPTCSTSFDRVPVEGDGLDLYAALDVTFCGECGVALCACCAKAACDACSQTVCADHLSHVADLGMCCAECRAALAAQDAEALPALACPACQSTDLRAVPYDFYDRETGYHDAGERFECRACGELGDAGDLVPLTLPAAKPMGAAFEAAPREAGQPAPAEVA